MTAEEYNNIIELVNLNAEDYWPCEEDSPVKEVVNVEKLFGILKKFVVDEK